MSSRNYEDKHNFAYLSGNVVMLKRKQSIHLLLKNTPASIRLRAITLTQTYSVSRFDEVYNWTLSDLATTVYPQELPNDQLQDIRVVYIVQANHKTKKVAL